MLRAVKLLSMFAVALVGITANLRADFVYDTVNGGFSPGNYYWGAADTGWYYTPTTDVNLVSIQTQLRTASNINNNVTFTTTVYSDRPAAAGSVLDSFTWNGTAFVDGPWLGGSFSSPLHLTGGTTYFLGFSGWAAALFPGGGAGVMMVEDFPYQTGPAYPGTELLDGYLSVGSPGSFDTAYGPGSWPNTPILRFIAADPVEEIPEPASMILFGLGGLGLIAARRRRQVA